MRLSSSAKPHFMQCEWNFTPQILVSRRLRIILRLGIPQLIILTIRVCHQLLAGAVLHNMSLIEHCNMIAEAA